MERFNNLTTPDEFIAHYFNELKTDLNTQNIQLSKVGFAGFVLNLMGNTQYDAKTYYDNLFKEAFVATAQDDKNLGYHSNVFGYVPALASYSKLNGFFEFNLDALPVILSGISKREINLTNVILNIEGLKFTLASEYKLVLNKSGNSISAYAEITTEDGKQKIVPFQTTEAVAKIYDLNQYLKDVTTFKAAEYVFGTHYSYEIDIGENDFVTRIEVFVNGEQYDLSRNKSFAAADEKVVFYEITPDNKLNIELGSGINGTYVPGSTVEVIVFKTRGILGNIGIQSSRSITGNIHVFDYDNDGDLSNRLVDSVPLSTFMAVNIDGGTGGVDPLSGVDLRKAIIEYIQSRNNLMSETDFRQILNDYFQDFEIIFKKLKLCENIFFVYQFFKDRYQNPIYTTSLSVLESDFISTMVDNSIYYPEFELEGEAFISPFLYIYDPLLNLYNGYIVKREPTFYSTQVSPVDPDDFETPPLVFLQLEYNVNTTTIYMKSYQDIANYNFSINIPTLEINDVLLTPSIEENTLEYTYSGIIKDVVDIGINVYDTLDIHKFTVLFEEVQQVVDISDILQMKAYKKLDLENYIVNLMLIHKDTYLADEDYYLNKIVSVLGSVDLNNNRMMSDDVQFRFLNTYFTNATYLRKTTLQEHNISTPEITEITVRADSAGDLSGTYFALNSIDYEYYVWFNVDGLSSQDPRPNIDLDNGTGVKKEEIQVDILENATVNNVRDAMITSLNDYENGEIFTANLIGDGILSIQMNGGGQTKNIRDPDPLLGPNLPTSFTFNITQEGVDVGIKMPLKLNVNIKADKTIIVSNNITLSTELDAVKLELATFLYDEKTKIYQKFYSSEIVDILHNKEWVKSATASITDVDGRTIPDSALEIYDYQKIESDLKKEELLDYVPILYWFDLDGIVVNYTL